MNGSVSCLTSERLRQLSADELSPPELEELEEHVTHCENCRCALEMVAAESGWRQEVRDALTDVASPAGWSALADSYTDDGPHDGCGAVEQFRKLLGPTDDPRMLGRIGPYEIVGILGRGGMGVVFKGFDGALNRYVAIKMLLPHLAASGAARKRFAREAQAAAAVVHDHVMAIHSVAEWQGVPYLVMPYGRGVSLQKRLNDEGPLEVREILRIGMQTAAGLAAAHAQGLVHRDVKPANIMLDDGVERVTLTDFGLARAVDDASLTRVGVLAGTPQYMSPEQARGQTVDARSDLFSLGSVLYAMCTGRPPFRADSSYGVLRLISDDEPTPVREINPEIPQWLCQIIEKLMSKRPADRFESTAEAAELLETCLAHVQQPATAKLPASLRPQAKVNRFPFISRRWPGVIAMIAVVGLGLLGIFAWQATEAPDIAGKWSGPDWGNVVLTATGPGEYEGNYTDTFKEGPGAIEVKWSRLEGRYKGTWREGKERSGKISLRLVDGEIRGAWTTSKKSEINPGTPELADLYWTRTKAAEVDATFGPVIEQEVRNREAIDFDTGNQAMMPDAELNADKGLLWVFEQRLGPITDWMSEEKMDALSDGTALTTFGLKVNELTNADWDTMNPSKLRDALVVDWEKVDPRQFAKAIHTIDPKAPPHAILALRTHPTIAFQTREGGIGILQIMEITEAGFKVRFKLALSGATKQASGVPAATPGIRVQVLLSLETHTREMLHKNVGFDELSIMGSGLTGTVNGKTYDNIQAVMAHRCRLESFEEAEQGRMKKCWKATLFVPQGPASDGANRNLSQKRLDELQEQGVQFWLDHHRDQSAVAPTLTPETLEGKKPDQRGSVLTPKQVVENGAKLYHSRQRVAVQFKVLSAALITVTDEKGTQHEQYDLYAEETPKFSIRITHNGLAALERAGVKDIAEHFTGKRINVEGTVYGVGLDLISRPDTLWTYHVDLDSLDQLSEVDPAALETRLPMLEGTVTALKDQELVEISLGADDGLRAGDSLTVFRDKTYLGKVTIQRAAADKSVARIDTRTGEIRRSDQVLTAPHPEAPRIPLQVRIAAPKDMLVAVADERGLFDKSPSLKVPARLNLAPGKTYRLKSTNIAGREGTELYPTVEIGPTTARTEAFLAHNAIPIQFTDEDFDQALAGSFVIKVIYLPDPEFQNLALTGVEALVNTRLDLGTDPIAEADRRGSILAVIRLGNKNSEHIRRGNRVATESEENVGQETVAEPVDLSELVAAAKQFNADTAQVRKELFTPPIPDLTVERLRMGFRQSADLYRRHGKHQIADALQKQADTGRLPKEATGGLIGTGTHARDEKGQTIYRQVVPGLVLPDNSTTTGNQLVVLRPLELMYRKDGPVSKDYGDLFERE